MFYSTSVRTGLFASLIKPLKVLYPRPDWAEQSPEELWKAILDSIQSLLTEARVKSEEILAISMDAQMLGVVPVDESGNPLYNILTWLDVRASGEHKDLFNGVVKISGYNLIKLFQYLRITGGAPSRTGKDPLSKIIWFKKYMPDLYTNTWKFLNINGYMVFSLPEKV